MGSSTFIRRIDNLGRIVIPKEIRKKLKLKSGESLGIISINDEIILKRHSYIQSISKTMTLLFEVLNKMYKINIVVTDLSKIVYSNKNEYIDNSLSDQYIRMMYDDKQNILKDKFLLTKNIEVDNYLFKPLNINGDILGSLLILFDKNECNKGTEYVDVLYNLLISYLDV